MLKKSAFPNPKVTAEKLCLYNHVIKSMAYLRTEYWDYGEAFNSTKSHDDRAGETAKQAIYIHNEHTHIGTVDACLRRLR